MSDGQWACPWCEQLNSSDRISCCECGCWKPGCKPSAAEPEAAIRPVKLARQTAPWSSLEIVAATLLVCCTTAAGFVPIFIVFGLNFSKPMSEPLASILSGLAWCGPLVGFAVGIGGAWALRTLRDGQ
jgi:hypothetical protein